jgi:hypothetical protein
MYKIGNKMSANFADIQCDRVPQRRVERGPSVHTYRRRNVDFPQVILKLVARLVGGTCRGEFHVHTDIGVPIQMKQKIHV